MFWWNREQWEHRGGLRTVEDMRKEEAEKLQAKEKDPLDYTIFGNKRMSFHDQFFYSDRAAGKGYSDFVHNSTYPGRVYIWPPLRKLMSIYAVGLSVVAVFLMIDYEWFVALIKNSLSKE
uniref:Deltamethrin resistance protein prag01 domain-containing protein n=1 Tax=Ditylenchus dipsaci TaxID=166011 RepID=A0A915EC72_9BILA